ncbi:hypothetical protein GCM10010182_05330 [Actinomadura cremea]|nr:hypothetical protein GCM10010182_05330 [Actinomadura cremea]
MGETISQPAGEVDFRRVKFPETTAPALHRKGHHHYSGHFTENTPTALKISMSLADRTRDEDVGGDSFTENSADGPEWRCSFPHGSDPTLEPPGAGKTDFARRAACRPSAALAGQGRAPAARGPGRRGAGRGRVGRGQLPGQVSRYSEMLRSPLGAGQRNRS